jgi:hypothetical protein
MRAAVAVPRKAGRLLLWKQQRDGWIDDARRGRELPPTQVPEKLSEGVLFGFFVKQKSVLFLKTAFDADSCPKTTHSLRSKGAACGCVQ